MKFILLKIVKMPNIVDILTFICMINTTPVRLEARNFFICRYFGFYEQLNCVLSWVKHKKVLWDPYTDNIQPQATWPWSAIR